MLTCLAIEVGAKEPTSAIVDVTWKVSLGADGHVTALATTDTRVPKLHKQLATEIRSWRFSPGKVNGQPAMTETRLQMALRVSLVQDRFEVRIVSAQTGGNYRKMRAPIYPAVAAMMRRQGLVLLKVRYDESGAVVQVKPSADAPEPDRQLLDVAISSVKQWTFEPEVVGGHPLAAAALVPVCFQLQGMPKAVCDWKQPGSDMHAQGSHALALYPAAKLETDVIGRVL